MKMKKLSLIDALVEKMTSRNERNNRAKRARALRLENLESRELLSVAPGGEFLAPVALAAYESSVAAPAADVLDISGATLDGAPAETANAPEPLATPVLTVGDVSATTISVSWGAVPNAVRYSFSYKPSSETTWTNVNVGTNLSYTVAGLDPTSDYDLRLKAIGDGVNYKSVYSDTVCVQRPTELIQLGAPTVSARGIASDALYVEWGEVANAAGYVVSYKERTAASFTEISVGASEKGLTIDSLDADTNYYVRVKALGDGVYWSDSSYANSTPQTVKTKDASFLSIAEYEDLRVTYDELLLPESMADVNIIIPEDWTDDAIIDAIDEAQSTPLSDVILLEPEQYSDEVLDLSGVTIVIDVDFFESGGISFLSRDSSLAHRAKIKVNNLDVTFDALAGLTQFGGLDFVDVDPDVSVYRVTMTTTALGYDSAAIDLQDVGMYTSTGISIGGASHNATNWAPRVSANPSSNDYALLFVGGGNRILNKERYYLTLADYYYELVEDFSLDPHNIYILFADGDTTGTHDNLFIGVDFDYNAPGSYTTYDMTFATDLGTTVLAAIEEVPDPNQPNRTYVRNLSETLAEINTRMTADSHLLCWFWDHGDGDAKSRNKETKKGEEYISGWLNEIYAPTVRDALFQVEQGYVTTVFGECYAGGILDDIFDPGTGAISELYTGAAHFAGAASSNHYQLSWSGVNNGAYTGYVQTFKEAMRQCSTGAAAFEYTEQFDPFAAQETYNANEGAYIYGQRQEHPWHAGETFPIFTTSYAQGAPSISSHAETSNTADWSWTAVPDAASYTLEYGEVGSPNVETVENITSNAYTVRGLAPETNYVFRVKADNSAYSERAYVWTQKGVKETPSTVVTTELDAVDEYDGLISLREAIGYANSGDTIAFDGALQGKTIALTLGQLTTNKAITIDASNLWIAATSEPGLTISGQGTSRILFLDQAVDVEINGITLTNGNAGDNDCGGAIASYGATLSLSNCVITNNVGGGLCANDGETTLVNCLVAGNSAVYGGGLDVCDGETTLYNCTIADNTATYGGGVALDGSALFTAYNTIIATNTASKGNADFYRLTSNCVANAYNTLSSFRKWTTGEKYASYLATKPLFANAAAGDYTLAANSQVANKGDNQYVATDVDLAGNVRIYGGTVDMGAYESAAAGTLEKPIMTFGARTGRTIAVSWTAVPEAVRYSLSYKPTGSTTWTNKNVGTNLSYTITGLEMNTEYDVRLKAIGDGVEYKSVYSKERVVSTNDQPTPLDTPVLTVVTAPTSLTVSWNAVAHAERYSLSYKLAGATTWTNKSVGTNASYTITGLESNTEYDVQLKAIGDGVEYKSVYSATVRVATDAATSAILDLGDDLFDELDEEDFDLLAVNFVA